MGKQKKRRGNISKAQSSGQPKAQSSGQPKAQSKMRPKVQTKGQPKARSRVQAKWQVKDTGNLLRVIPLYFIVGVVPLIIYMKKIIINDPGNLYWNGLDTHVDIFSFYKMVWLLAFTAAGLLLYLFSQKGDSFGKPKKIYYIPLGIYVFFVFISSFASEYRQVAFFGCLDRYEGAFVLFAYCVIVFLAMNIFTDEKSVRMLFGCLFISAAIIFIIGALQYFGADIFKSGYFLRLIMPSSLKGNVGTFKYNVNEKTAFSTLYNPNYMGSYTAILMPVIMVFIIRAEKLWHKLTLGALMILAAINWLGCDSRAGMAGGALSLLIVLILFRKEIFRRKWVVMSVTALLIGGLVLFNFLTNGSVVERIVRMAALEGKEEADDVAAEMDKVLAGIEDILLDDDNAWIVTGGGTLHIAAKDGVTKIYDETGSELGAKIDNNAVTFTDNRFRNIRLYADFKDSRLDIYYNDYKLLNIYFTKDGLRSPDNRWLTYRNGREIEASGFAGMETLGSNRGYIWSRSIPLLKDTIITGNGPDTFALYFPQYDYLNKLRFYGDRGIFVDKVHNMYLQTALNTGVLSLLALLVLFGLYTASSIKAFRKADFSGFLPSAGAACFAAFCGYAVTGLFNDSVVSVAPVFWMLLGLGIGINVRIISGRLYYFRTSS